MGLVLRELDRLREAWAESRVHPLLGPASLHVPLLAGGRQLFIYAAECTADVECRTVPGQTATEVEAELRAAVAAVPPADGLQDEVETVLWRPAYEIEADRPIVEVVRDAAEKVRGEAPRLVSHGWWEDSAILGEAGIDTVILGPTGEGLHTEEEWVSADSVVDLAAILHESIVSHCGRA
jgi:acetylornithine deacetylase